MTLLLLFVEFFKIGLFSIGGGLATIPFIYRLADARDWITRAEIADMVAVAESTPGPIAINMATYTGFKVAGPLGSIVATLAFVLPALIIVTLVSRFLSRFRENPVVSSVFAALRPAAAGLIAAVAWHFVFIALVNPAHSGLIDLIRWKELILFSVVFASVRLWNLHPIFYIAAAGLAGILLGM